MSRDQLRALEGGGEGDALSTRTSRSQLPSDPPALDASIGELRDWLTVVLGLGADPVAAVTRYGRHLEARLVITLASSQRITFERQGEVFDARRMSQTVISHTAATMPYYGPSDAQKIATVIVRLADVAAEADDREEAWDWAGTFLQRAARNTIDVSDMRTPAGRYEALGALDQFVAPGDVSSFAPHAERSPIVRDVTGRRLVRVTDVAMHVRGESGRPIAWPALHSRMTEIGWEHRGQVQQRQPGGHKTLKARVYAVPAEWEQE